MKVNGDACIADVELELLLLLLLLKECQSYSHTPIIIYTFNCIVR